MTPNLPEKSVLDYNILRQEGIRQLERLAGPLWTDFNAHDPGITILEQLCYALTDLVYRCRYTLPDLLTRTGENPYDSLYSPARILTSEPVTLVDLRKLVVDGAGVKNAWIEPVAEPQLPLYYQAPQQELSMLPDSGAAEAIKLKGLYRVQIDSDSTAIISNVTSRLHANRPLCEDFEEIRVLDTQYIQVHARIEIGPSENPEAILLAIYQKIAAYFSPPIPFYTLSQALAAGKPIDEIFDGPRLEHGFIDTAALRRLGRRTALRTSDLIHEIMDVSGVRAVKNIFFPLPENRQEKWSLELDPEKTPRLDLKGSTLSLERKQLRVSLAMDNVIAYQQPAPEALDLEPPPGRDRRIGNYYSLQHQFPALYGIGELGLPASASEERKAQAKQLKAYLLFFDQLLANDFAQLAHVRELFGFQGEETPQTYFASMIDDPKLGLEDIRVKEPADHQRRLQQITENPAAQETDGLPTDWRRKNRFLDHLLARFAEQFTDYSLLLYGLRLPGEPPVEKPLAQDKRAFLQQYPEISSARGTAFNYLLPWGEDNLSGLEQRLRLKLGATGQPEERFYLVEHILLRPLGSGPLEGDNQQGAPLLADARCMDPYSLQLSLVFPNWPLRFQQANFKQFIEQTIREETPAHLTPYLHWLDKNTMDTFKAAYQDWLTRQCDYWTHKLGLKAMATSTLIQLRDARDRLIDLLGIGQTYPLRDLAIRDEQLMVAFNTTAKIPITNSQRGVIYRLCDQHNKPLYDKDQQPIIIEAEGNGGELLLETPRIQEDITYTIKATKRQTGKSQFLLQLGEVKVGLDTTLKASSLAAPLLDPVENPPFNAPRIVDYGASVEVEIQHSQEGVDYRLVYCSETDLQEFELSLADKRGDLSNIVLQTQAVVEDIDIRIRATKTFDPSEHLPQQTALLAAVLPLKVRANPALAVAVEPVIDFNGTATLKIAASQASTQYRLYARRIPDSEFIHGDPLGTAVLKIPVAGKPDVQVKQPAPPPALWETPPGYAAAGEFKPGNGGELVLTGDGLTADSLIIVQAQKEHRYSKAITSAVQLQPAVVVLVRPDPARQLQLRARLEDDVIQGPIQVLGGQPGVFYHFRTAPDGDDLGLPGYFHQRDAVDPARNKGVDQLQVEVDFVIAPPLLQAHPNLAETPPEPPTLDIDALPTDTSLFIRAVKAQTGLEAFFEPVTAGALLVQPDLPPDST